MEYLENIYWRSFSTFRMVWKCRMKKVHAKTVKVGFLHSGSQIYIYRSKKGPEFTFSKDYILGLHKSMPFRQLIAAEDKSPDFRNVVGTLALILHIHTYSWNREDSSHCYIFSSQFPDVMILSLLMDFQNTKCPSFPSLQEMRCVMWREAEFSCPWSGRQKLYRQFWWEQTAQIFFMYYNTHLRI